MLSETLLTAKDIAKYLQISNALAYRLISEGQIPACRFGRTVRVKMIDLERWIALNMTSKNIDPSKLN
jgi:excisionase family DNA binding protein